MAYAEKRGDYWRARYWLPGGKLRTVSDTVGAAVRFHTRREAERAANDAEVQARSRPQRTVSGRESFGDYASRWYAAQDLAASTMQNYRRHIEEHLLAAFEEMAVADILRTDVAAWEKRERLAGYSEASIRTWRSTLHLILADAVDEGLRDDNPATRRRGRGRRAGRSRNRGPEKAVTTALGVLLIAERAALLSGRDDEFVAIVLAGFTGMRWGELVGLETRFLRPRELRVEWQLYELEAGNLDRCPPKDESRRTIDLPGWLARLGAEHVARVAPRPCACHGYAYVFRGYGAANGAVRWPGPKLVDVARRAAVSTGTVSNVLNRPDTVPEATRVKVRAAIDDLGYMRGEWVAQPAPYWRRNGFATWLFQPAATGRYPRKAPQQPRPVPLLGGAVARDSGARPQRGGAGGRVLAADCSGPDPARAAAHPPDVDGRAGHAREADG